MDTTKAQQISLDDALVASMNRLKIGKFNHRLSFDLKSNDPTIQVVLDTLKLTPFYNAFQITANVPKIYMCLSGKTTGIDSLRLSCAQILWGMYYKKNVDYVNLLWEDLKADEPVQSSSISFDFTSKFLNIKNQSLVDNEIASMMETLAPHATVILEITSSFTITTLPPHSFLNPPLQQQTPTFTTPTFTTTISSNPTVTLQEIHNFASFFKFDQRLSILESELSELKQTNQFAKVMSFVLSIVDKCLASKMKEAVNDEMIKTRMKTPLWDQTEGRKEGNLSVHGEKQSHTYEELGMQQDQEFVTGNNDKQPVDKEVTKADLFKKRKRPPTLDPDWSKRRQIDFRPPQTWITQASLAKEPPTSFDEFNDT
uniref:Uncharacterized protein n=1 Tax=Tanacetum cinerariifolium TaxID=118510 RepID=A0A6L2LNH0_TANCI|nr:hypothetical protein [Tanacetum cinerariifolium]